MTLLHSVRDVLPS